MQILDLNFWLILHEYYITRSSIGTYNNKNVLQCHFITEFQISDVEDKYSKHKHRS